jgi:hypothetical protein
MNCVFLKTDVFPEKPQENKKNKTETFPHF